MENFLNYSGQIAGYPEKLVLYMIKQHLSQHGDETIAGFEQNGYRIVDWSKTPEGGSYWNNIFERRLFDKFLKDINMVWTLGDFYYGRVAIKNDGTLSELETVLKSVFPNDTVRPICMGNYYIANKTDNTKWDSCKKTDLPKQSVRKFLEQIPVPKIWTLEDLRLGNSALENDGTLEELKTVLKHVFPEDTDTDSYKMQAVWKYYSVELSNKKLWSSFDTTNLPTQSVKTFLEQIPVTKVWTLEDLRLGNCALENDDTLEKLLAVLKHVFPNDNCVSSGKLRYYYKATTAPMYWSSSHKTHLPKQSVKEFFKQLPVPKIWKLEDLRLGNCVLENDGTLEELKTVLKYVFPKDTATDSMRGDGKFYYTKVNNKTWSVLDNAHLPSQSVKIFLEQIPVQKVWTLEDISYGNCALENDGTIKELQTVLRWAFPKARRTSGGNCKFYYKMINDTMHWCASDTTDLPKQSVKEFFNRNSETAQDVTKVFLTRKQLIELYDANYCQEWKSRIKEYLSDMILATDDQTIEILSDDISTVFQKGSAEQKELLQKLGINPIDQIDLSKYPNGFYQVTIDNGTHNIEKISDKLYRKVGEDCLYFVKDIRILNMVTLELVIKK
jgi:hypothetical protein